MVFKNLSALRILTISYTVFALVSVLSCSSVKNNFDVSVKQPEDVNTLKTLETEITVTPEKAALHPEYQTLEKIAVPYAPEYRMGPGDIIEIVYHLEYYKSPQDYRLEVEDKISINFPFHPQFSTTVFVRTDGKITVPLFGDVPAESKTPEELAAYLNKEYSKIIKDPCITVTLEEFNVKVKELKKAITTAPRGQSKIAPITPDGRISFPLVGTMQAEGYTVVQLEKFLNEKYSKFIRNLKVTVIMLEIHHAKYYVIGEVKEQGAYEMTTRTRLIDALARAKIDIKRACMSDIVLIRNDGLERPVAYKIDAKKVLSNGFTYSNLPLRPADIIYVPKTKITTANDVIEKIFTLGVWSVMPFTTNFSWGVYDIGGDYNRYESR